MNPYISIEGMAGVLLFFFCATLVFVHIRQRRAFQAIDFTIISMGVVYGGLFPLVVHTAATINYPGSNYIIASHSIILAHSSAAFMAAIGVYFGWRLIPARSSERLQLFFRSINARTLTISFFAMTILALVTQYLYTKDYGGFFGYFAYNRLIRSGSFDLFERSSFSFLFPFGGMAVLACYGFWGLILSGKGNVLVWTGFLASLSLSSYYLLASAGRVSMFVSFSILLVSYMLVRKTKYATWFLVSLLAAPVSLSLIFIISNALGINAAENFVEFAAKEASFLFTGFFAQLSDGFLYYSFREVLMSPAYLLPSSMTNEWLFTAADLNTEIILGVRKGTAGNTSSMPTDILTFGIMQFGFIGVFLYSTLFGAFVRFACCIASSFRYNGVSSAFLAYVILRIAIFGTFYSYPQHLVFTNFPAVIVIGGIVFFRLVGRVFRRGLPCNFK